MLILRGLVIFIGGLAFIFLPGAFITWLTRRDMRFGSSLLLWGLGLTIALIFVAQFISNLVRVIITGNQPPQGVMVYVFVLLTSLLVAAFVEGGKYLVLRFRNVPAEHLTEGGLVIGLGSGLIINVFVGIGLVWTGASLLIGDTSTTPDLANAAAQEWPNLVTNLLALIVYRIGLVATSTALGVLAARALITGSRRWLWLAIAIDALVGFIYTMIGLISATPGALVTSLALIALGVVMAIPALRWLAASALSAPPEPEKKKKRPRADAASI